MSLDDLINELNATPPREIRVRVRDGKSLPLMVNLTSNDLTEVPKTFEGLYLSADFVRGIIENFPPLRNSDIIRSHLIKALGLSQKKAPN